MAACYLGLMSGTSLDGIDAAIFDFSDIPKQLFAHTYPLDSDLRKKLTAILDEGGNCHIETLGRLDHAFGHAFGEAARQAIEDSGIAPEQVAAVGSHGQTAWHAPDEKQAFTLQLGDPSIVAAHSGRPVVADFRRKDMALGGQGAPLSSGFHREIFSALQPVAVINLGGIANITVLEQDRVSGFDTGPANALMDAWYALQEGNGFDRDGKLAASGSVIVRLLDAMLADPFFNTPPPRSTGKEYFNLTWLRHFLEGGESPEDIQATLCELTARTVANEVNSAGVDNAIVVGGGAHNPVLMDRLEQNLETAALSTSAEHGYDPDFIEAGAFAWLAMCRMEELPGNIPQVTGASRATTLGGVYLP